MTCAGVVLKIASRRYQEFRPDGQELYFAAYEYAKRDIEIKEEKTARLRVEQLEVLKKKEKKNRLWPEIKTGPGRTTQDALVISVVVPTKKFDWILVDTGSSVDILFKLTLDEIGITGSSPFQKTMMLDFVVVDEDCLYKIILGRTFLRISKAVVSNHYLALKYQVNDVVGVERYDTLSAEVEKLLRTCFIREVEYPEWVSNVVLVKKSNGKWRITHEHTAFITNLSTIHAFSDPSAIPGQIETPKKRLHLTSLVKQCHIFYPSQNTGQTDHVSIQETASFFAQTVLNSNSLNLGLYLSLPPLPELNTDGGSRSHDDDQVHTTDEVTIKPEYEHAYWR
ncbi:hypothetical protein WN943_001924 [Citrus x changshan-huyou]